MFLTKQSVFGMDKAMRWQLFLKLRAIQVAFGYWWSVGEISLFLKWTILIRWSQSRSKKLLMNVVHGGVC